ncbi:MAG: hypothetical protein JNK20_16345 [Flavipsychrobacter sp.]|nr:hypothetical protein [Flavipsychrobacter sp.]
MDIRFLSLGLFVRKEAKINLDFLSPDILSYNLKDTLFHFDFNLEEKGKYNLEFSGGYYDPIEACTQYYHSENVIHDSKLILYKKPSFFAILIAYPILKKRSVSTGYFSEEWANNPKPFKNMYLFNKESTIKRFNSKNWKGDLSEKIIIDYNIGDYHYLNNFFENNCYPIFLEDPSEIILLINDYADFLNRALGVSFNLQNISKVLIPFFEISNEDNLQIPECGGDDLPF